MHLFVHGALCACVLYVTAHLSLCVSMKTTALLASSLTVLGTGPAPVPGTTAPSSWSDTLICGLLGQSRRYRGAQETYSYIKQLYLSDVHTGQEHAIVNLRCLYKATYVDLLHASSMHAHLIPWHGIAIYRSHAPVKQLYINQSCRGFSNRMFPVHRGQGSAQHLLCIYTFH